MFSHTAVISPSSTDVEFNKLHLSIITLTTFCLVTNASFNIISCSLWQLFTEPGGSHPRWVAKLTAGRDPQP